MLFALMVIAIPLFLGIIFIKPKWGSLLIWSILFTYPHSWWYYHQFLPLNIGVDDLFCIFLFLTVLIRRNFLEKVPIRFGYAFWTVSFFAIVAAIANVAGSTNASSELRFLYLKDILKLGVYWGLFFAVLHCIDDVRDLKMQFTMFSIAAVLGAILVIIQNFYPYTTEIFGSPETVEKGLRFGRRATGAFMNANVAASVLACSSMLVIAAIRLQKILISKLIVYTFLFILFVGVMLTRSRSGLIALGGGLVLMSFLGRSRKVAWFVIVAGLAVSLIFTGMREAYVERVQQAYDPTTGVVGTTVAGRFMTWSSYLKTATARDYLLGQGFRAGIEKNGMESHNVYVSLITVYGIGGVIWAIFALTIFFRKVFVLRSVPDLLIRATAGGCLWALIVWGIYAMAADALNAAYTRYLLFYLVVLLDRAYVIAMHQQEVVFYEGQTDQLSLYPEGVEVY